MEHFSSLSCFKLFGLRSLLRLPAASLHEEKNKLLILRNFFFRDWGKEKYVADTRDFSFFLARVNGKISTLRKELIVWKCQVPPTNINHISAISSSETLSMGMFLNPPSFENYSESREIMRRELNLRSAPQRESHKFQ